MIDPALREDGPQITDRLLRQFAALCLVIFGSLALVDLYGRPRAASAVMFGLLATGIGIFGLIRPRAIQPVFYIATALTKPVGWVVSRVLLGAIFYIVFAPIALIFRLIGRDALKRRLDTRAATHWQKRPQPSDVRSYLHQ